VWRLDGPDGAIEAQVAGRFSANTAQAFAQGRPGGNRNRLLPRF